MDERKEGRKDGKKEGEKQPTHLLFVVLVFFRQGLTM
jgi:hypothetical protein